MTRAEAVERIRARLDKLTDEQIEALAEIAESCAREIPPESPQTVSAIAEGVGQAKSGLRAAQADVEALLRRPWR